MTISDRPTHAATEQQVNDLFDSLELTQAIDTEEFRVFLDHIPIPIIISKLMRGDQRIVYANAAYEALTGQTRAEIRGRGWSVLASFTLVDEPHLAFSDALAAGDDFMGTFKREPRCSRSWKPTPASSRTRMPGRLRPKERELHRQRPRPRLVPAAADEL